MNQQTKPIPHRESRRAHSAREGAKASEGSLLRVVKGAILGVMIGALTGLLALLGTTAFLLSQSDPSAWVHPTALAVLGAASLLAGFMGERLSNGAVLPVGAITAALWSLLVLLFSCITGSGVGGYSALWCWIFRLATVLLVLLGTRLGRPRVKKPDHRKRHHGR